MTHVYTRESHENKKHKNTRFWATYEYTYKNLSGKCFVFAD